jgi:putative protein-disulfide isomerase
MKTTLILLILLSSNLKQGNSTMSYTQEKTKIIYVFDVLCGWCYGFSPVIKKFHETYKDQYDFEIISGGLVVGERIGPYGEFANYILNAIPNLEKTTGVKVGDIYLQQLKEDKLIQNSIPPAIAISIVKQNYPENSFEFAHNLQIAKFLDGKDLNNVSTYLEILDNMNLKIENFKEQFESVSSENLANIDFSRSAQLGVRGFPAVIVKHNGEYTAISNGYIDYNRLNKNFVSLVK